MKKIIQLMACSFLLIAASKADLGPMEEFYDSSQMLDSKNAEVRFNAMKDILNLTFNFEMRNGAFCSSQDATVEDEQLGIPEFIVGKLVFVGSQITNIFDSHEKQLAEVLRKSLTLKERTLESVREHHELAAASVKQSAIIEMGEKRYMNSNFGQLLERLINGKDDSDQITDMLKDHAEKGTAFEEELNEITARFKDAERTNNLDFYYDDTFCSYAKSYLKYKLEEIFEHPTRKEVTNVNLSVLGPISKDAVELLDSNSANKQVKSLVSASSEEGGEFDTDSMNTVADKYKKIEKIVLMDVKSSNLRGIVGKFNKMPELSHLMISSKEALNDELIFDTPKLRVVSIKANNVGDNFKIVLNRKKSDDDNFKSIDIHLTGKSFGHNIPCMIEMLLNSLGENLLGRFEILDISLPISKMISFDYHNILGFDDPEKYTLVIGGKKHVFKLSQNIVNSKGAWTIVRFTLEQMNQNSK